MRATKPRNARRELLKKIYDDQVREFPRESEGTQIIRFLEDAIRAIPNVAINSNKEDLAVIFRIALKEAIGEI